MVKFNIVGFTLGLLLTVLGIAEFVPAFVDWGESDNAYVFFQSAFVSLFFGISLILSFWTDKPKMSTRESFLLTTLSWVLLSFFSAIPLYLSDINISFTDAMFETVSGLTTTGSTVLSGLDDMSRGILLWRSIIQWIGGIGIIGFAIVFLPFLRIGGMELFKMESSDESDKIMPRTAQVAGSVLIVYVALTMIFAFVYNILGMSVFDAINHGMTTIATAGYSTHDKSFAYFDSYAIDMAATLFMFIGSLPFMLYVRWVFLRKFEIHKDEQAVFFLSMMAVFIGIMTFWLWTHSEYSIAESFRYAAFSLTSVISSSGFVTTDYLAWGGFATIFFLFATYLGGCAGSTTGGLKTMRLIIAVRAIRRNIRKMIYPHSVSPMRYQGKVLDTQRVTLIFGFISLYMVSNVFFIFCLTLTGLDLTTSVSAVGTAISNVGPGIGDIIGPSGNFASLPSAAKWILDFCMILGRLEILTVMALFLRGFW
ncbi:MAG: TrkH family potassium uptake protein [Alphaproteobacteria bacterium]|nr:TrkH family potassium uptake protein [Alphaproteobacteria bacterium]